MLRTVRMLERGGSAGIQIDDQALPKRCGYFGGLELVGIEEMLTWLEAAKAARTDPDFVILARTDVPLVTMIAQSDHAPELSLSELDQLGCSVLVHTNLVLRAMHHAARDVLTHLRRTGEASSLHDRIISWDDRQRLVHIDELNALEDELRSRGAEKFEDVGRG